MRQEMPICGHRILAMANDTKTMTCIMALIVSASRVYAFWGTFGPIYPRGGSGQNGVRKPKGSLNTPAPRQSDVRRYDRR